MPIMTKFFATLLMTSFLMVGSAFAVEDVVFVDLQEIFKRFYKTQLAQDQIRQQADDIKIERELMEDEIKTMKEEIEVLRADSRDSALSDDLRASKRDQLEEKLVDLQKREQEMIDFEKLRQEQLEQQNTRMSRKLFDEIHEAIIEHAREMGYKGVIDRAGQSRTGLQLVLYASPKADITADILELLNEGRAATLVEEPEVKAE
jgi:Skp family chaperone for outer membrane proteins